MIVAPVCITDLSLRVEEDCNERPLKPDRELDLLWAPSPDLRWITPQTLSSSLLSEAEDDGHDEASMVVDLDLIKMSTDLQLFALLRAELLSSLRRPTPLLGGWDEGIKIIVKVS